MKPVLRRAYPTDRELIVPLLRTFPDTKFKAEDWNKLFEFHWDCEEDYIGYVLISDEKAVGFIGTTHSRRMIEGVSHKFCGLSSWIVDEAYRTSSLSMLMLLLSEHKDYTITNFTPIPEADLIFRKLRWEYLEDRVYWLPGNRQFSGNIRIESVTDATELSPEDRKVADAHLAFTKHVYKIRTDSEYTLLIGTEQQYTASRFIRSKWKTYPAKFIEMLSGRNPLSSVLHVLRIQHCSNQAVLNYILPGFSAYIRQQQLDGTVTDARFTGNKRPDGGYEGPIIKTMYKPCGVNPAQVDAIYTEVFILGH